MNPSHKASTIPQPLLPASFKDRKTSGEVCIDPNMNVVFTVRENKKSRERREEKRCNFPERDRKASRGITGSQREYWGIWTEVPKHGAVWPESVVSSWKIGNGESGYCLMWPFSEVLTVWETKKRLRTWSSSLNSTFKSSYQLYPALKFEFQSITAWK